MFCITNNVFVKQVSRSLAPYYKITGHLLGCETHYGISLINKKAYVSQKSNTPTDGSDKNPPSKLKSSSKLTAKSESPNLTKNTNESTTKNDADKLGILFSSIKNSVPNIIAKLDPFKWISRTKFGVAEKPPLSKKNSSVQCPTLDPSINNLTNADKSDACDGNNLPMKKISATQEIPTNSPKKFIGSHGYEEKDCADNWTPSVKYGPILPKSDRLDQHTAPHSSFTPNSADTYSQGSSEEDPATVAVKYSTESIPTNSPKKFIGSHGYEEKDCADNWKPSVKYGPILPKPDRLDQHTAPHSSFTPNSADTYSQNSSEEDPATVAVEYSTESKERVDRSGLNYSNISGHWVPTNSFTDTAGYYNKRFTDNWIPTTQNFSGSNNSGLQYVQDNTQSEGSSSTQFNPASFKIPATSASFQTPVGANAYDQANWVPTQQYFAADFSQRQDGYTGGQLQSNWTTQYCADSTQPAGGSGASPGPSDSSNDPSEKSPASNPSTQSIYNIRKYSPELPTNSADLQFKQVGDMPTGIFRCHTGEYLGPGAAKGGVYQNPEYYAFHNMTYYDLHLLLRGFRRPSPDTKRKL